MLQIVMPMAGRGERFKGYSPLPKPAIPVAGKPMVQWAIESLPVEGAEFHAVVLGEHAEVLTMIIAIGTAVRQGSIIPIPDVTEGAACTVLKAEPYLRPDEPLLIADCDRYAEVDWRAFFLFAKWRRADAAIATFRDVGSPRWSYSLLDADGYVERVAEKEPIGDMANAGFYFWLQASDFFDSARRMIAADDRVNGEFYVAPVYNHSKGRTIVFEVANFEPLGTPEDVRAFEARRCHARA